MSICGIVVSDITIVKEVAGIVGSTTMYNVAKDFFENKSKVVEMKKDSFYVPFLFHKLANK
jgi:hypothetical protein